MANGVTGVATGTTLATNSAVQSAQTLRQVGWEGAQNLAKLKAAHSGMENIILGKVANTLQGMVDVQGIVGSYCAVRKFQEETCGDLGAIGANPAVVTGASNPLANQSWQGLSALGELGIANQEKALLLAGAEVNGKSFFGFVGTLTGQLEQNFGIGGVNAQFEVSNVHYSAIADQQFGNIPNGDTVLGTPLRTQQQKVRGGGT